MRLRRYKIKATPCIVRENKKIKEVQGVPIRHHRGGGRGGRWPLAVGRWLFFIVYRLSFIVLFIYVLISAGPLQAEVNVWVVGEGGLPWSEQSSMSAAVDFGRPEVIQPNGFTAGENIMKAIHWMDGRPDDFTIEGQAYVWDNAAVQASNLVMVDGDSLTSTGERFKAFGVDQTGRTFYFDLGASYPANRIVFYPSPDGKEDFVRAFEISINNGRVFSKEGRPIYSVLRRVEVNTEPTIVIEFPLQLLRFIKLRILASNRFEIAEVEIYGLGFVPRASYLSKLIEFEQAVNFGELNLKVGTVGDGTSRGEGEVSAMVQIRNGADDTPLLYYRVDPATGSEEGVSEEEYAALSPFEQGPIRNDAAHWSPWSNPIQLEMEGIFSYPLDFLPGPRRYFQFRVFFTGSSTEVVQLHSLSVTYSPALAQMAVGEVALLSEPDPPGGVATTPTGRDTFFTYDVRAQFDTQGIGGFDGLRIETSEKPRDITLAMGEPLNEVFPDSVRVDSTSLTVYFPSHRVTRQNNRPLRVIFRTAPLRYNTTFRGWLLDTGGNLPQPILPGDASEEVKTGSLQVFGSLEAPLRNVDVSPDPITPNGDGQNDKAVIAYDIFHLVAKARVEVRLYDLSGRSLREVFSGLLAPGKYRNTWDGRDDKGHLLPPGIYTCKVSVYAKAGTFYQVKTITVVY